MQLIAEVGANHDGDLDRAVDLIRLAAAAGADVVKFQHFRTPYIVSGPGFRTLGKVGHHASWSQSVEDVFRAAETPWDWTPGLKETCDEAGVEFLSSPYDLGCVDHLDPYVQRWKIGSGEITHRDLLRHVAQTGKPVLLATGASRLVEVLDAVEVLEGAGCPDLTLLHCTTNYSGDPALVASANLAVIPYLRRLTGCPVGLSDHTRSLGLACAAAALGAVCLERHFTDDRHREGPDHHFAMEPADWLRMAMEVDAVGVALGEPRKVVTPAETEARVVQRRCWRATRALPAGHVLEHGDMMALRPCPENAYTPMTNLIGAILDRDVTEGEAL